MKKLQITVTFLVASPASGGAITVVTPIAPHTVLTVMAVASAIQELLRSHVLTSLPSVLRHLLNVAIAPHLTTTLVAGTPLPPIAPQAIDHLFS